MSQKYQVLALIGKAGAGKDYIQNVTCSAHPGTFHKIVSCTTRPMRDNEVDGKDYHFLSIPDFTRKVLNGEMLEATEFRDWFYGTSIDSLDINKINIGVFNPAGISALLESPELNVKVVYVDACDKTRLMRYLTRSENPDCAEMCRRYFTDNKDFETLDFDYYYLSNEGSSMADLLYRKEVTAVLSDMHSDILDASVIKAISNDKKDKNE